jgi:hypothetical protein
MAAPIDRDIEVRDLAGVADVMTFGAAHVTGEQADRQRMIAEITARLF